MRKSNDYQMFVRTLTVFICISNIKCDLVFPPEFTFGVTTSAYQVEGAWNLSGKTPSIWDHKTHTYPEQIKDKSNGDIACDSYHKIKEDVKLMRDLGLNSYRFSLSWTRILPNGFATYVNPDGIRYYNELIDELLRYNITPMVTIYHWDLPYNLALTGGWTNPEIVDYFTDFARVAFENFGDRVKFWLTINEPRVFCELDYIWTYEKMNLDNPISPYLCGHQALKAHAKVYHLYKKEFGFQGGQIGICLDAQWFIPQSEKIADKEASIRSLTYNFDRFAHPIFSKKGDYPPLFKEHVQKISKQEFFPRSKLPVFTDKEVADLKGASDFLGFNHYVTITVKEGYYRISDKPSFQKDENSTWIHDPSWEFTDNGFTIYPKGFYDTIMYIKNNYHNPVMYATENGCSNAAMDDINRQKYLKGYLESMTHAIRDGANVLGYYAFSLFDNFEWFDGYTQKFGLYHVDFLDPSRPRTARSSALIYQKIIEKHNKKNLVRHHSEL